jgi:hypothetical protein
MLLFVRVLCLVAVFAAMFPFIKAQHVPFLAPFTGTHFHHFSAHCAV